MPNRIHSPLPASMSSECKKAGEILGRFVNPESLSTPGREIPAKILAGAKGLAIFTVSKVGAMGSIRLGSGIIVARLDDGTWSAPSAMGLAGVGGGGQFGFELADFVFILHSEGAMKAFSQSGTLTVGGNASLAFGPIGRILEGGGAAGTKGVGGIYAWSTTRGLFGGVSLEGSVVIERSRANKKIYGRKVTANEILQGEVEPPPAAEPLMQILSSPAFSPAASQESQESPVELSSGNPDHPTEPSPSTVQEAPTIPAFDFNHETNEEHRSELAPDVSSQPPSQASPEAASDNHSQLLSTTSPEHPSEGPSEPLAPQEVSQSPAPGASNAPGVHPQPRAEVGG